MARNTPDYYETAFEPYHRARKNYASHSEKKDYCREQEPDDQSWDRPRIGGPPFQRDRMHDSGGRWVETGGFDPTELPEQLMRNRPVSAREEMRVRRGARGELTWSDIASNSIPRKLTDRPRSAASHFAHDPVDTYNPHYSSHSTHHFPSRRGHWAYTRGSQDHIQTNYGGSGEEISDMRASGTSGRFNNVGSTWGRMFRGDKTKVHAEDGYDEDGGMQMQRHIQENEMTEEEFAAHDFAYDREQTAQRRIPHTHAAAERQAYSRPLSAISRTQTRSLSVISNTNNHMVKHAYVQADAHEKVQLQDRSFVPGSRSGQERQTCTRPSSAVRATQTPDAWTGEAVAYGASLIRVSGAVRHVMGKSEPYEGINGVFKRSAEICNTRAVLTNTRMPAWAMWFSDNDGKLCWCVGKKEHIGTEVMFAYVESTGLGPEEAGKRPWTVYSYTSQSWETQSGIEVMNLDVPDTKSRSLPARADGGEQGGRAVSDASSAVNHNTSASPVSSSEGGAVHNRNRMYNSDQAQLRAAGRVGEALDTKLPWKDNPDFKGSLYVQKPKYKSGDWRSNRLKVEKAMHLFERLTFVSSMVGLAMSLVVNELIYENVHPRDLRIDILKFVGSASTCLSILFLVQYYRCGIYNIGEENTLSSTTGVCVLQVYIILHLAA